MGWVHRVHVCKKPRLPCGGGTEPINTGDIWKCVDCGQYWKVAFLVGWVRIEHKEAGQ